MDRRSRTLLALAGGCAVLFGLVVLGAYFWGPGQSLDLEGLTGFVSANDGSATQVTWRLLEFGDPPQVAVITLLLAGLAVARGRPRTALLVLALVAATSVSSQILKAMLAHPRVAPILGHPFGSDALPSGHATAAMSLALAGVLAAPRRARLPAALVGAMLALGVGGSVVAWGWHFPSDVLAGYLLATGWAFGLVAVLWEAERRFPATNRGATSAFARASDRIAASGLAAAAVGAGAIAALAGLAVLAALPHGATDFAREHTSFVVVAAGVASAALALPVAMAAVMRRG